VLVAALVLAVVLVAAVLLPITGSGDVVATATLEPLDQVPEASAHLVIADDQTLLEVNAPDLPATDGYYELWLMTGAADALISLGPIGMQTRATVPSTIDLERFFVIDVSREAVDGNPAHSTDSVLRGELRSIADGVSANPTSPR
jgi:hypothetical protein